jgi:hypothetical protein
MKVFMCKRDGGYSGGLAVVAANTKEEAFEVFHSSKCYEYMVDHSDIETGEYTEDLSRCNSFYYRREDWFEVPILTADTIVQKFIAEGGYTE